MKDSTSYKQTLADSGGLGGAGEGGGQKPHPTHPRIFLTSINMMYTSMRCWNWATKQPYCLTKVLNIQQKHTQKIIFCLNAHNTKGNCGSLVWLRGRGDS